MEENHTEAAPVQILEVRAGDDNRPVTVTAAFAAPASQATFLALSEQLDRLRRVPATSIEEVLAMRERVALVERFEPAASAGAHTIVRFSAPELHDCLLALTDYRDRVDGEYYQAPELRDRLRLIDQITTVLWDANAAAASAVEPSHRTAAGGSPVAAGAR